MTAPVFLNVLQWLETHQLPCPVKSFFHVDCPGCGLQRSFVELLKGNISASFALHPVTIPLLLFFIFSALHLYFKFKKGNSIVIYSYIFIAVIVLSNYIYKLIHQHLT
ncbi:MAG: DUF2752 domain-containing protein [Ferruginibacter sp.]